MGIFLDQMTELGSGLTHDVGLTFTLIFFTAVIALYSVFVYYFYQFLARKNILQLNLSQYNRHENPSVVKFFAVIFYIAEYLFLLPLVTLFWFAILAMLILLLAEGMEVSTILLISAALVAAVRVTAHVSTALSRDLAKMLPFTLLAIAITKAGFFEVDSLISRISEIPTLFSDLPYYLLFIVAVELIMRIIEFVSDVVMNNPAEIGDDDE